MTAKEVQVRRGLGPVVALIETASLILLLVLFKLAVLPDRMGVLLVVLLPICFGLHVTEEFLFPGGFIRWDNVFRPKFTETPGSYYIKVNAFPGIASVLLVLGAFDYMGKYSPMGIRTWLAISTFMTWNAFFHLRGSIQTKQYSPGMITGLALFVPLTIAGYVYLLSAGAVDIWSAAACIAFALAVQPVLDRIKGRGFHALPRG